MDAMRSRCACLLVGALIVLLPLTGCGGGDGGAGGGGGGFATTAVQVSSSMSDGVVGETFTFQAVLDPADPMVTFAWDDPAGNEIGTGDSVTFTPTVAGTQEVTARAMRDGSEVARGGAVILAFQASASATPGTVTGAGLTGERRLGDVDDNGIVELRDAVDLARLLDAGDFSATTEEILEAVDIDSDGRIDEVDLALLQDMILGGSVVPTMVVPSQAHPGTLVQIFHPTLVDPASNLEVAFNGQSPVEAFRPRLGQLNVYVPFDLAAALPADGSGMPVSVEIFDDAVSVATLEVSLSRVPMDPTLTPRQGLMNFGTALRNVAAGITPEIVAAVETITPMSTDESFAVSSFGGAFESLLVDIGDDIEDIAMIATEAEAEMLWAFFVANGALDELAALEDTLMVTAEGLPASTGRVVVSLLCQIDALEDALETPLLVMTAICASSAGLAIAFPVTAPITGPIAVLCGKMLAAASMVQLIVSFVPPPPNRLEMTAMPTTLSSGESSQITVEAPIYVGSGLCSGILAFTVERATKAAGQLLASIAGSRRQAWQLVQSWPLSSAGGGGVAANLRMELEQLILDFYENVAGLAAELDFIASAVETVQTRICDIVRFGSFRLTMEPDVTVLRVPDPSDAGTLVVPPSGSLDPAIFTCDPDMTATMEERVRIDSAFCSNIRGSVEIRCQPGGNEATICFGDNGSLLDDIFELRIDGVTVSAPTSPVTNVCVTEELSVGTHTADLIGRAAPDGIGTYFISFGTPITNVMGPPTSGSNLVAGATFTWTFEIPGASQ